MRIAALVSLLLCAAPALAQQIPEVRYPLLPASAAHAEAFVPTGWAIESRLDGDLNADQRDDLVLVLRQHDPGNIIDHDGFGPSPLDSNPRILAVAFARPSGGYALAVQNHTLIPRHEYANLADVLEEGGVSVQRGTLQVRLYFFSNAGSWSTGSTTYTFRWQQGAFALIGYDNASMMRNSGQTEALSINYSTGRMRRSSGSIESDQDTVRWERLPSAQRWTLDTVGDGAAFEPLP